MNKFPKTIRILSHTFTLKIIPDKEFEKVLDKHLLLSPPQEDGPVDREAIAEVFDVKSEVIFIRDSFCETTLRYTLLHAIWEVLLNMMGQYFNHEGFTGFSYVLFSTLVENNLSFLFEGAECQPKDQL